MVRVVARDHGGVVVVVGRGAAFGSSGVGGGGVRRGMGVQWAPGGGGPGWRGGGRRGRGRVRGQPGPGEGRGRGRGRGEVVVGGDVVGGRRRLLRIMY